MEQLRLFGEQPKKLEKVPWRFKYVYRCDDENCKSHEQTVRDWEVFQLYRNLKNKMGEQDAVAKVKDKLLHLFSDAYDSYFIVGSIGKKPTFIIGGLFYPKRTMDERLSLWMSKELV